jgi:branched-chain amino acid transport system substrate-binding protein
MSRKVNQGRRRFVSASIGAGVALGVGWRPVYGQAAKPIKIGVVLPQTGVVAQEGIDNLNGMKLYIEQVGGKVAGRPIELIVEDSEFKPQVGLQKLRKLVESDKVDIVTGPVSSAVATAMDSYVKQSRTLWVISGAALAALTRARKSPLTFRTSTTTWQTNAPLGQWAYKNMAKEALCVAMDFAGGRDSVAEFKSTFVAAGGKVIQEVYTPIGNKDFSPYFSAIKSANPPLIYCFFAGVDSLTFIKQYDQFGLKAKIPLAASGFTVANDALPAEGKSALGVISCLHYTDTLDTPANKKFVAEFKAKTGRITSVFSEYGYVAARAIVEALKKTDGNTENKEKVAEAMRGVAFDAPRGPFRFDPVTHNVIQNEYIRKVVDLGDRMANQVIETIPNVQDPGK